MPFSPNEIKKAIRGCQGKKSPGPDGIPIEFYWAFCDKLSVVLCKLYNSFIECDSMNSSMYDGIISLLYKGVGSDGSPGNLSGNFRKFPEIS